MQTMLCIMYSQHLYEMQLLSFLLACNLLAIFQAEQGQHRYTYIGYYYSYYTIHEKLSVSSITRNIKYKEVSELSEWLSQLSVTKTHYQVACVNEEVVVFLLTQRQHRQAVNI